MVGAGLASALYTYVAKDSRFVWVIIAACAVIVLMVVLPGPRPRRREQDYAPSWQDQKILGAVPPERPKTGSRVSPVFGLIAFLVGAALVLVPARGELMDAWGGETSGTIEGDDDEIPRPTGQPTESTPEPQQSTAPEAEPIDYFSTGLPEQIEAIKEAGPSTKTTGVTIWPDWISYKLATAPDEVTIDDWRVWDGVIEHQGAASTPIDPDSEYFDFDEISWDKVPAMVDDAFDQVGWTAADLNADPYVIVQRAPFWGDDYPVTVHVYLPHDRESHYVVYTPDGEFIEVV